MYDAIIIGGGPAGLQAALTLGRLHRTALVLDSGDYRNAPADHMHNAITHDGREPAEFRAMAQHDLAAYETVQVRSARASRVSGSLDEGFTVEVDGAEPVTARRLVLATGVRDTLPEVPGLRELFGTLAAHCPFCHGHEYAGTQVGLMGEPAHAARMVALMGPVASGLTVFAPEAPGGLPTQIVETQIVETEPVDTGPVDTVTTPVASVRRDGDEAVVELADGTERRLGGILVGTTLTQSAPFAEQLGLDLQASGSIRIDDFGRTSLPGVYAAGDLAHTDAFPMAMASVISAAAAGLMAGSSVIADAIQLG